MQTIKLDISQKNNVPLLYVKQRDVGHTFAIELYENGMPYSVDEGNTFSVWYSGASGDGNYTTIGDETAVFAERNVITVQMIMQMVNEPGGHEMCVVMYGQDNEQKGFWNIPYYVEAIPGADSEGATAYYNAFLDAQRRAEEAAERAEEAADRAESAGGGSGGGTIIVGIDEGNAATHTASEIYNAIQNKQTVVFHHTGRLVDEFVPLKISKPDLAVFSKPGYPSEFDIFDIKIDRNGQISYEPHFGYDLVNRAVEKVETDIAPVSYLPQTPTPEQKAQARENIGVDEVIEKAIPVKETSIEPSTGFTVSGGKLFFDNYETTQSAVIPVTQGQTVIITVSGTHNRFVVCGMTDTNLVAGAPCTTICNSGITATRDTAETFEFTNEVGFAQLVVALAYRLENVDVVVNAKTYTEIALGGIPIATKRFVLDNIKNYRPYISKIDGACTRSLTTIYEGYDALKTAYPEYVSMSVLGTDAAQNEIREYTFATPNYNLQAVQRHKDGEIPKETILIIAGVHGYEQAAVASTLQFFTDLCNGNEALYGLRETYIFKVIPVVTPYSLIQNTRTNINGVNINRNFDANWSLTEVGDDYSSEAPADQLETQIVQNWIDTNTNAKLFMDIHNSGYVNEVSYLAADNSQDGVVELKHKYLKGIDGVIPYWRIAKKFSGDNVMSYTGNFDGYSGISYMYAQKKGLLACCLECSWAVDNSSQYSTLSVVTGAEAIGNMLIEFLDT